MTFDNCMLFNVFSFIFGACVGSFINVCAWRIPRDESIVSPPSKCPHCGHMIRFYENVPILSWIFLRAKCSSCRTPISARYIIVEAVGGVLFLLCWLEAVNRYFPAPWAFFPGAAAVFLLINTAIIDFEHRIIPDEITVSVAIAGVIFAVLLPMNWFFELRILHSISGFKAGDISLRLLSGLISIASGLASYAFFAAFAKIGKRLFGADAFGWGDVKYMCALGACLGIPAVFFTALLGSLCGSAYGLALICIGKAGARTPIPLGPFLALGTLVWILFGNMLLFYLCGKYF